jgi:hypothetical protein
LEERSIIYPKWLVKIKDRKRRKNCKKEGIPFEPEWNEPEVSWKLNHRC